MITSNASQVVREFLEREGLAGYVVDVLGGEADVSKVRKIGAVMAEHDGQSGHYYVGDTRGDMRGGRPGRSDSTGSRLGLARRGRSR